MRYARFGPFDVHVARAISSTNPIECVEFWGDITLLEGAGSSILTLGYNDEYKGRCNSHHFGGQLSTVNYKDAKMMLCQIDNPAQGIFICEEDVIPCFQKGFRKLIEERLNPESSLTKYIEARKKSIRKQLNKIDHAILAPHVKSYIEESKILERDDSIILNSMSVPEPHYMEKLEPFLKDFYSTQYFGRAMHIGMVLHYFGLPANHFVKPAKRELRHTHKNTFSSARSRLAFEVILLKEQLEGSLFSLA